MKTDYSCFLHAGEDGHIWWRLEDAIKLGAGYIPVKNDDHNLVPVLRPPNQRVRVNERTLVGAFSDERLAMVRPKVLDRDGSRLVDASDFLGWLSQYVAQTQAEIPFPNDLVRAVRRAAGAAVKKEEVPPSFDSLTAALSGWFDKGLSDLPPSLSDRVREDLWPLPWDRLSAEQREDAAKQWDYQNDPATEAEREAGWDLVARRWEVEAKIREWERVGAGTAGDLATKEARLAELREEITTIDLAEKRMVGSERGGKVRRGDLPDEHVSKDEDFEYIAYPRAMKRLRERLGATPQEVAAWLFFSETPGRLVAYTNANELDPPPKFGFSDTEGDDYVSPLMACWFRRGDIEAFEPDERYITGRALIERWGQHPDIDPRAFMLAKIRESRLLDLHPGWGRTQPTWLGQESSDPLESGLFALSHVKEIEAEDFGLDRLDQPPVPDAKPAGHLNHDLDLQRKANAIAQNMLKKHGKSYVTRDRVAAALAKDESMTSGTVARRIRKQW